MHRAIMTWTVIGVRANGARAGTRAATAVVAAMGAAAGLGTDAVNGTRTRTESVTGTVDKIAHVSATVVTEAAQRTAMEMVTKLRATWEGPMLTVTVRLVRTIGPVPLTISLARLPGRQARATAVWVVNTTVVREKMERMGMAAALPWHRPLPPMRANSALARPRQLQTRRATRSSSAASAGCMQTFWPPGWGQPPTSRIVALVQAAAVPPPPPLPPKVPTRGRLQKMGGCRSSWRSGSSQMRRAVILPPALAAGAPEGGTAKGASKRVLAALVAFSSHNHVMF